MTFIQETQKRPSHDKCLFIIGATRSGTTLLQNLLTCHPQICVTYETRVAVALRHLFYPYDVDKVINALKIYREFQKIDFETLKKEALSIENLEFADLVALAFRKRAKLDNKTMWGDKTPNYVHYIPNLASMFPNSIFIHIIRDPRAVSHSLMSMPSGNNTPYHTAMQWRYAITIAREEFSRLPASRRIELLFENLLKNPEKELKRICALLRMRFTTQMLKIETRKVQKLPSDSLKTIHPHYNKSIDKKACFKWRKLSRKQIYHIESICWDQMIRIGYKPISRHPVRISQLEIRYYRILNGFLSKTNKLRWKPMQEERQFPIPF